VSSGPIESELTGFPDGGQYNITVLASGHQFDLSTIAAALVNQREAGANAAFIDAVYNVQSRARFVDTMAIGEVANGRISYHFDLDGALEWFWRRDGGDVFKRDMYVRGTLVAFQNGVAHEIASSELNPNQIFGGNGETFQERQVLHRTGSFTVPFNQDEPFEFAFLLTADNLADIRNVDGGAISGNMNANFGTTARLLGVTVYDEQGRIVPNPVITSSSGLVYNLIIPEPASAVQMAGAILMLMLAGRGRAGVLRGMTG
jgi:hypothetical protein